MENLILDKQVDTFFVGNHGGFDRMVKETLLQMQKKYPHITCRVVLAYLPSPKKEERKTRYQQFIRGLKMYRSDLRLPIATDGWWSKPTM